MDNDTPRYGSRDDEETRRYSDDPAPSGERSTRPSFLDRPQDNGRADSPAESVSGTPPPKPGGLEGLRPSRFDDDADIGTSRNTFTQGTRRDNGAAPRLDRPFDSGFRSNAGSAFGAKDEPNPLLKPETSTKRFSWEDTEPAKPATKLDPPARDYEPPKYEPRASRFDDPAPSRPAPAPAPDYGSERYADPGYNRAPAFDSRQEPAYQPPQRGYQDPGYDRRYADEGQGYDPYEAQAYQGAHARELADVDQDYAREYQYNADPVDPRQSYGDYDLDYAQYDQPYGEYPPQKKRRGPILLLASLVGVAVIAGALIFAYQSFTGTSKPVVPKVVVDEKPRKLKPETTADEKAAPPRKTKLIYDRIRAEGTEPESTLVPREEQPGDPDTRSNLNPTPNADDLNATPASDTLQTATESNDSDPLPLPLPPPPSNSTQNTQTTQPTFNTTTQTLNIGGQQVDADSSDPPAPASSDTTTSATDTTTNDTSNDAIAKLIQSPPLPKEKPTPPSRQAEPGPAVPTGPIQIAPLPGSVERDTTDTGETTTDQAQPTELQPAVPDTQTQQVATEDPNRQRSGRFSEELTSRPVTNTTTQDDTQVALAPQPTQQDTPTVTQPAAPITGGRYAVEVGIYPSQQDAQTAFQQLQSRHQSLVGSYQPIIQQVNLGATGTRYRLYVGPIEQRTQASRLCGSLIAAGQRDCIVRDRTN